MGLMPFSRRLVKVNDAVHRAVVGDGQRGKFQFMRLVHQPVQPAGAIEQGILGVQVQMNKVRVRHGNRLHSGGKSKQEWDVQAGTIVCGFLRLLIFTAPPLRSKNLD